MAKRTDKTVGTTAPWWKTEGIWDGPGIQEPESHRIRVGGGDENILETVRERFTEEAAGDLLADHRWNFTENVFYKGLGIRHEQPEWERTRRFYEHLRKHAGKRQIHTGVYTQWAPFFVETLPDEIPQVQEWTQVDYDGKPIPYGYEEFNGYSQTYRWRMCPSRPGFLEHMKAVCRVAIRKVKAEVVYFDNMCLFEGHDSPCYCSGCRDAFRAYMRRTYPTADALYRRTGLRTHKHIVLPPFHMWRDYTLQARPVVDPMIQEFIEFRCEQLANAWAEIGRFIKTLDPKAGLMGNPSFPRKYSERMVSSIDFWRLKDTEAFYYMENSVGRIGIREGALVSNIRGFKYGRQLGITFVPLGRALEPGLNFAECLAFNDGSGLSHDADEPSWRFFTEQREAFYRDVEVLPEIAVLRDDRSLTLRWHETFSVMETAQQQLLHAGLPWMPLWGQQLTEGTLARYATLVVPGCGCLSGEEVAAIMRFVETGGTAVILENAGCYNERHETVREWRFAPLFDGAGDPGYAMRYVDRYRFPAFDRNRKPMSARFGKGKAVYLPLIRKTADPIRTYDEIGDYSGFAYLAPGANWNLLPNAILRHAARPPSIRLVGSQRLAAEFLRKTGSDRVFAHVVNYGHEPVPAGVKLVLSDARKVRNARIYIPAEGGDGRNLKPVRGKGGVTMLALPRFARYALVVLD